MRGRGGSVAAVGFVRGLGSLVRPPSTTTLPPLDEMRTAPMGTSAASPPLVVPCALPVSRRANGTGTRCPGPRPLQPSASRWPEGSTPITSGAFMRPHTPQVTKRRGMAALTVSAIDTPGAPLVGPALDSSDSDVISCVTKHLDRDAVIANDRTFKYGPMLSAAVALVAEVSRGSSLAGERIAIMAPPGVEFVLGTWAAWLTNATSVPLALSHPPSELEYVIQDAGVKLILTHPEYAEKLRPIAAATGAELVVMAEGCPEASPEEVEVAAEAARKSSAEASDDTGSLIIYTSGTTGRPKGVLHTRSSISAQVASLSEAWQWEAEDHILHTLPLHHVHGLVNALQCAHANGAVVEFASFGPKKVWNRIQSGEVTVFMGVPTMYSLLFNSMEKMTEGEKEAAGKAAAALRLAISGSAACPLVIMEQWQALTGKPLLERYGMTEIGMALSNPLNGERRPGFVGTPLPGVKVKMVVASEPDEETGDSNGNGAGAPLIGELRVKAPQLFSTYWGRPEATSEAFDEDGFFLTGDTVTLDGEPPYWRIVGRTSVDIIKYSGYKISALDIENKMLQHPNVKECAILGVPDEIRGQLVGAVVAFKGEPLNLKQLSNWCRDKMPEYHLPRLLVVVDDMPRNAMGKINKKQLLKDAFPEQAASAAL